MSDSSVRQSNRPWADAYRAQIETPPVGRRGARPLRQPTGGSHRSSAWLVDARVTSGGLLVSAFIVVAMIVGSSMVVIMASVATLAVAVLSPLAGTVALAFTAPLPRPLAFPTPGLYITLVGAIILGAVLRLPTERPRLRRPSPEVLLMGAFMLYVTAHFLGGLLGGYSGPRGTEIASLFASTASGMLAFLAVSVVVRNRSPRPILAALLLSAAFVSGMVLAEAIGAEGLFGELIEPALYPNRMTGPFGDPNYAGSYLAVAATLAVAHAVVTRSLWLKVAVFGLAGLASVGLLLTLSRGGLVALGAGLMAVAFSRGRRVGIATAVGMLLVVVIAYPIFAEMRYGASSDIAGRGLGAQIESSDRIGPWLAGLEVFLSEPLFGVGWGSLVEETSSRLAAHNWYVALLAETGIIGFAIWAFFIASVLLALRRKPPSARTVGYSVLVAWMTASLFVEVPVAYGVTGPVLIVLATALSADWSSSSSGATASPKAVAGWVRQPRGRGHHPQPSRTS